MEVRIKCDLSRKVTAGDNGKCKNEKREKHAGAGMGLSIESSSVVVETNPELSSSSFNVYSFILHRFLHTWP